MRENEVNGSNSEISQSDILLTLFSQGSSQYLVDHGTRRSDLLYSYQLYLKAFRKNLPIVIQVTLALDEELLK